MSFTLEVLDPRKALTGMCPEWDTSVGPLLMRCFDGGVYDELTLEDVKNLFAAGLVSIFVVRNANRGVVLSFVTEFVQYPQCKKLRIVGIAGKRLKTYYDMFWGDLCKWARMSGCSGVEVWASPAASRLYRRLGFTYKHTVLTYSLGV